MLEPGKSVVVVTADVVGDDDDALVVDSVVVVACAGRVVVLSDSARAPPIPIANIIFCKANWRAQSRLCICT